MASEFDKLLEETARALVMLHFPNGILNMEFNAEANEMHRGVLAVLKRRLLPLLEAGQAMRDDYTQTLEEDPCELWDAAKQAALEGR